MRLADGAHVVIVGGGPAGSLTAIHLLDRARAESARRLRVTLVEVADFDRPGQPGCNKCAGILSSTLVARLARSGLTLPPEVIQSEIDTYALHLGSLVLTVSRAEPERRIFSVFRGCGPREGEAPHPRSFDGWLLEAARQRGAEICRARVSRIERRASGERPRVHAGGQAFEADLVVLATGINSRAPLDAAWGYRPPPAETMAQDEFARPATFAERVVHVYFGHPPGLVFGAVIPKGRYANVSLLGRSLSPDAVSDFIAAHGLGLRARDGRSGLCGCAPRVAVAAARGTFDDRLVAVGDAAVTRLYKDGIGSADITAEAAARTALERGVSRADFAAGYAPTCRRIATDGRYGRLCFALWDATRRLPPLLRGWERAVRAEQALAPEARLHTRMLWGMFTGDMSYRQVFWLSVSPRALLGLVRGVKKTRSV
jgi:flavin-dependent dehydrogenase